jgi:hypothetical protein
MGFSVDASLTLVSDPGSLIELGPVGAITGGLPNIGVFAGSTVPEPASILELGLGLLLMAGAWSWRRNRTRKQLDWFPISRRVAARSFLFAVFLVCLLTLTSLSVLAGTITVDNIDQPISVSSTGFSTTSISYGSAQQQATFNGDYFSQDPLATGLSVTYTLVFQEPASGGSGFVDVASTELLITSLVNPTSTQNTSVEMLFDGILNSPINPGPGIFFLTEPGGFFDVAAYLRGQPGTEVPADLSVLVATVPEPSSLALGGIAATITMGIVARRRSGKRSAARARD